MTRASERLLRWSMLAAILLLATGCSRPPQLGSDEDALRVVDALWTAVTAKQTNLVDQTMAQCEKLKGEGRLSPEAFDDLNAIATAARAGEWDDARGDLRSFIEGQRREAAKP